MAYTPVCHAPGATLLQDVCSGRLRRHHARAPRRLVKLTENAFRDTNIAFANELSLICDRFDINVWEVIDIANRHPRVNVLRPGPGVEGTASRSIPGSSSTPRRISRA